LLQFWLQPVPYADLSGDNYVDFKDYAVIQRIDRGQIWIAKHSWFCHNVHVNDIEKLAQGWTYTVWENKPLRRDFHTDETGFDWVGSGGKAPICRANYKVFERIFPKLKVADSNEPMYIESLPPAGTAPQIIGWEVAVLHGSQAVEIWDFIEDGYIEPRCNGITKLCIWFDQPMDTNNLDPNNVVIRSTNGKIIQPSEVIWQDDFRMVSEFYDALPDRNSYQILVNLDVKSVEGYVIVGDRDICITILEGDANRSREVNTQDLLVVYQHIGESVDTDNAGFDINCSDEINTQDLLAVYANIGHRASDCTE